MSEIVRFVIAAILMGCGVLSIVMAVVGVYRFKFVMNRMHSAAMIDTMGLFFILAGLAVATASWAYIPKLVLILGIQWVGSPIASHFVGRLEVETDKEITHYVHLEDDTEEENTEEGNTGEAKKA